MEPKATRVPRVIQVRKAIRVPRVILEQQVQMGKMYKLLIKPQLPMALQVHKLNGSKKLEQAMAQVTHTSKFSRIPQKLILKRKQ